MGEGGPQAQRGRSPRHGGSLRGFCGRPLRPGAARRGGEGRRLRGEVMTVDQSMLEQKMEDFCIRVLSGAGTLQEMAVLPHILEILLKVKKSRQD